MSSLFDAIISCLRSGFHCPEVTIKLSDTVKEAWLKTSEGNQQGCMLTVVVLVVVLTLALSFSYCNYLLQTT